MKYVYVRYPQLKELCHLRGRYITVMTIEGVYYISDAIERVGRN